MNSLIALGLFAVTQVGSIIYDRFVKVELPPVGRVNWIDVLFILAMLNVFPFLLLVLPSYLILLLFAFSFASGLYYAFRPLIRQRVIIFILVAGLILTQILNPMKYLNDVIVMITVVGISVLYVQSGLRMNELALLGIGYSIYDLIIGMFTPFLSQLTLKLTNIQIAPAIIVGNFAIGAADVLLVSLYVVALKQKANIRLAAAYLILSILVVAFIFFYLLVVAPSLLANSFPLAPWITIPFLIFVGFQKINKRRS